MKVTTLDESAVFDIGHAFGYYDYGQEIGLVSAFSSRDAAAAYIRGYVRGVWRCGLLYTTSERGEGYMRKVMELAFAEGDRLGLPVILDTDAQSKCDKYLHLGMELAGIRTLGNGGMLYDLIRYPRQKD